MQDRLTVMSWNLNGETSVSDSQRRAQLDFVDDHCTDVDVFLFQAVRNADGDLGTWDGHLETVIKYFEDHSREYYLTHTGDWAHELMVSEVQPHEEISGAQSL